MDTFYGDFEKFCKRMQAYQHPKLEGVCVVYREPINEWIWGGDRYVKNFTEGMIPVEEVVHSELLQIYIHLQKLGFRPYFKGALHYGRMGSRREGLGLYIEWQWLPTPSFLETLTNLQAAEHLCILRSEWSEEEYRKIWASAIDSISQKKKPNAGYKAEVYALQVPCEWRHLNIQTAIQGSLKRFINELNSHSYHTQITVEKGELIVTVR